MGEQYAASRPVSLVSPAAESSRETNGSAAPRRENGHAPLPENARVIMEQRYLRKDTQGQPIETPEGLFHRVAGAVSKGELEDEQPLWEKRYYDLMASLRFLPNSPTLVNAGTGRGCLSACFVVSPEDTMESIMEVAHDAAMIEKWGGRHRIRLLQAQAEER